MPTWEDVVEIGTRLPGVEAGTCANPASHADFCPVRSSRPWR